MISEALERRVEGGRDSLSCSWMLLVMAMVGWVGTVMEVATVCMRGKASEVDVERCRSSSRV